MKKIAGFVEVWARGSCRGIWIGAQVGGHLARTAPLSGIGYHGR